MKQWLSAQLRTMMATQQIPYIMAVLLPMHAMAVLGLAYTVSAGMLAYAWWILPGFAVFGGLGAAVMLHRHLSHRSLELRPWLRPMLLWISCMSGQGSPIWWAALHRGYHHAHADRDKDIHSPMDGFWHAYMGWMFGIRHDTVSLRHAADLLRDRQLVWFHKNYNKVIWASLVILAVIDPFFCLWFYVIPMVISLHADSLVNSVCHTKGAGYRRYDSKDQSENVWYLGLLHWGQGWHNNHHSNPRSYDFGTSISGSWKEFDPCLLWVPIISPWSETKKIFRNWRNAWAG